MQRSGACCTFALLAAVPPVRASPNVPPPSPRRRLRRSRRDAVCLDDRCTLIRPLDGLLNERPPLCRLGAAVIVHNRVLPRLPTHTLTPKPWQPETQVCTMPRGSTLPAPLPCPARLPLAPACMCVDRRRVCGHAVRLPWQGPAPQVPRAHGLCEGDAAAECKGHPHAV
eukprot:361751-Chlamydomonas_euryale.AAC.6